MEARGSVRGPHTERQSHMAVVLDDGQVEGKRVRLIASDVLLLFATFFSLQSLRSGLVTDPPLCIFHP